METYLTEHSHDGLTAWMWQVTYVRDGQEHTASGLAHTRWEGKEAIRQAIEAISAESLHDGALEE